MLKEMQGEITNERELSNHLQEKLNKYFPLFKLIQFQFPVIGCITGRRIVIADIAFKKCDYNYLVEIKFNDEMGNGDFWSSLKVIGYTKSMNLTMLKNSQRKGFYKPVIMINKDLITYDILPILYHLKCGYISFEIKDNFVNFDINLHHNSNDFI